MSVVNPPLAPGSEPSYAMQREKKPTRLEGVIEHVRERSLQHTTRLCRVVSVIRASHSIATIYSSQLQSIPYLIDILVTVDC